jgi:hypothetical protein
MSETPIQLNDENKFVLDFLNNITGSGLYWLGAKRVGSNFEWNNNILMINSLISK